MQSRCWWSISCQLYLWELYVSWRIYCLWLWCWLKSCDKTLKTFQFRSIHTWTGHGLNYIHVGPVSGWSCFFMLMFPCLKMEWQLNSMWFHGSQSLGKWLVLESLSKCWISYNIELLMTVPLIISAHDMEVWGFPFVDPILF
jgi:hypothetical protein